MINRQSSGMNPDATLAKMEITNVNSIETNKLRRTIPAGVILLAVLTVGFLSFLAFLPRNVLPYIASGIGILFLVSLFLREPHAVHVTLLALLIAVWNGISHLPHWPYSLLIPLLCYTGAVIFVRPLRRTTGWLKVGVFDRTVWFLMGLTVFVSSAALLLWFIIVKPDLDRFLTFIPGWNPALLFFEGFGFAILNAAMEESVFRGVMMGGLDSALGQGALSIILQAIAFGFFHIQGIPGGWIGVGMAMIYGFMLGMIRRRSGGILAPFITHVFADMVIFAILVLWVG